MDNVDIEELNADEVLMDSMLFRMIAAWKPDVIFNVKASGRLFLFVKERHLLLYIHNRSHKDRQIGFAINQHIHKGAVQMHNLDFFRFD